MGGDGLPAALTLHKHVGEATLAARVLVAELALLRDQTRYDSGVAVHAHLYVIEPEGFDPERTFLEISLGHWFGNERAIGGSQNLVIADATAEGGYIRLNHRVAPVMLDLDQYFFDRTDNLIARASLPVCAKCMSSYQATQNKTGQFHRNNPFVNGDLEKSVYLTFHRL